MHLGAELWDRAVTAIGATRNEDSVCSVDGGGLVWDCLASAGFQHREGGIGKMLPGEVPL